jgi:hypothetical protein
MHDRLEAESVARAHVCGHLAPQVTMIDQTDCLDERALDAIADHPRTGATAKIGSVLTSRPANDLRVCSLSAHLGYGIQAFLVGATIVELVGVVAYLGDSESRAANWAEHSDLKHTYPRKVAEGIEALLNSLPISSPGAKENWLRPIPSCARQNMEIRVLRCSMASASTPVASPTCAERIPRTLARLCPPRLCTMRSFWERQEFMSRSVTAPKKLFRPNFAPKPCEPWRPSTDLSHGSKSCIELPNWNPQRAWLAKVNNQQSCHSSTQRPSI